MVTRLKQNVTGSICFIAIKGLNILDMDTTAGRTADMNMDLFILITSHGRVNYNLGSQPSGGGGVTLRKDMLELFDSSVNINLGYLAVIKINMVFLHYNNLAYKNQAKLATTRHSSLHFHYFFSVLHIPG